MKLLRLLNTDKIQFNAEGTDGIFINTLKHFLVKTFFKDLMFVVLKNKLNREDIPIFKANQLKIFYNAYKGKLYFIFYKTDDDAFNVGTETNSAYYDNDDELLSLMLNIELTEGETLHGFELDFINLQRNEDFNYLITDCLKLDKNE